MIYDLPDGPRVIGWKPIAADGMHPHAARRTPHSVFSSAINPSAHSMGYCSYAGHML
jgi:hypothetical protein